MERYNNSIENWWRHLGCYGREQASGKPYVKGHVQIYLELTDSWWYSLTEEQRLKAYNEFFGES